MLPHISEQRHFEQVETTVNDSHGFVNPRARLDSHVSCVKEYYDRFTSLYLEFLGPTFQGRLFEPNGNAPTASQSNRNLAVRAGLGDAEKIKILDAGCGVCGPAIDFCQSYAQISIDAITISDAQVAIAKERVSSANLDDRVKVFAGDFHALKRKEGSYDQILFLESLGHAFDKGAVFNDSFRLLRSGGMIYIKDAFVNKTNLNYEELEDLKLFEATYIYKTHSLIETADMLVKAGFQIVFYEDLERFMFTEHYIQAMFEDDKSNSEPNAFGKIQVTNYNCLPLGFGDILALRP